MITDPRFEWPDDGYRTPPWSEMVIYELHPGTFNDRPGGRPGSFRSVLRRLDHLERLSVNVIELMPSLEFAADFSWGYSPARLSARGVLRRARCLPLFASGVTAEGMIVWQLFLSTSPQARYRPRVEPAADPRTNPCPPESPGPNFIMAGRSSSWS